VLINLVSNAIKFSSARSKIAVELSGDRLEGGNQAIRCRVIDEGPGIPEAAREQVFEKFYRIPGRQSHDPRRKGIGLGLPIARRLVEAQGGRIWVESPTTGTGTIVRFTLPVAGSVRQPSVTNMQTATPPVGAV